MVRIIMIIGIALFPPAILAYVSQDALPGDIRYPVKRIVESGVLAVASVHPTTKAMFSVSQSNTRLKEMLAVVEKGESTQVLIDDIIKQNEETVAEISRVSDTGRRQELIKEFQKNTTDTQTKIAKAYKSAPVTKSNTSNGSVAVAKVECVVNGTNLGQVELDDCNSMRKLAEAIKAQNAAASKVSNIGGQGTPDPTLAPTNNQQSDTFTAGIPAATREPIVNSASIPNNPTSSPTPTPTPNNPLQNDSVNIASIPTPMGSVGAVIPFATPASSSPPVSSASIPDPESGSSPSPRPQQGLQTVGLNPASIKFPEPNDTGLEVKCGATGMSVKLVSGNSNSVRFGRYSEYPNTSDPSYNTRNAIGDDSQGTGGYLLESSLPIQLNGEVLVEFTDSNRSSINSYWVERGTVTSSNYIIDRYVDFQCN